MSERKVVIKTAAGQFACVRCLHCDVLPDGATRERARQHVQNTGHTVRYVTENITTYEPSTGSIPASPQRLLDLADEPDRIITGQR